MVNFPGLNSAPARSQLPMILCEPVGSTETRTLGRGGHRVLPWGRPGTAPWCPQGAENSAKWTQEPVQSPSPPHWGSDANNLPSATLNVNQGPAWCSGDKLETQFCLQRGSQRGRSRHRRAMSLDGVTRAPLSTGTNKPLRAGAPPETRGGWAGPRPVLRAGCPASSLSEHLAPDNL